MRCLNCIFLKLLNAYFREAFNQNGDQQAEQNIVTEYHEKYKI